MQIDVVTPWGEVCLQTSLLGGFNASNLLAVLSALVLSGMSLAQAAQRLSTVEAVPGRMENFGGLGSLPLVVVDYAHTPDALEQVLLTLKQHCAGVLWCVFGCGGDRDRAKRPAMGAVAGRHADQVIVTDDNPRNEDGDAIVRDILAGMDEGATCEVRRDRSQAISDAINRAAANDIVLVAGKGHEDYQLVGSRRLSFSDREHVRRALEEVA